MLLSLTLPYWLPHFPESEGNVAMSLRIGRKKLWSYPEKKYVIDSVYKSRFEVCFYYGKYLLSLNTERGIELCDFFATGVGDV